MADKFINPTGLEAIRSWILTKLGLKQDTLVSGTNIKTLNNQSLLGSGNINIEGGGDKIAILEYEVTTFADVEAAVNADKILYVDSGNYRYPITFAGLSSNYCDLYVDPFTNAGGSLLFDSRVFRINAENLWSIGSISIVDSSMSDTSTNPVRNSVIKSYVDTQDANLQSQIDGLGEPFRLQEFTQQINVTIPSITTEVSNTQIPNVDVDLDVIDPSGQLNQDFAIASLAKYEVYDATSGGNRLNVTPICSFSMNGQRTLRIRMMCAGPSSKTARRITGAILLKHR